MIRKVPPFRLHPVQALYIHDRVVRSTGRALRAQLPPGLAAMLRGAQRRADRRAPFRSAARILSGILSRRPFPSSNAPTALLCGLAPLLASGWRVWIPADELRRTLRRWRDAPPTADQTEAWLRRRCRPST